MSFPNVLTLSRVVLSMALIFLLEERSKIGNLSAFLVFVIASLTDFYDGHWAKQRGLVSDFGKIMDPVADKILLLSAFGVLAHIGQIHWWMFIAIAAREILVTASRLWAMRRGQVLAAERAGKIKTVAQMAAVSVIFLYLIYSQNPFSSSWVYHTRKIWLDGINVLMWAAVILTVYSGAEYFRHKSKMQR